MKKVIILITLMVLAINGYSQKITFQDILNGVATTINSMGSHVQNVSYQTFVVNSSSNARLLGGHDKVDVQVNLPANTMKWFYRLTVVDKFANFEWPDDEKLFSCISNGTNPRPFAASRTPINVYLMNNAADNYNFTTNQRFSYIGKYSVLNTDSYFGACNLTGDLWLGVQNVVKRQQKVDR